MYSWLIAVECESPMSSLRLLIPLLATAGLLIAGNGLAGTLVALRGVEEGMSASLIGLIGAGYYAGFIVGCWAAPQLLRAAGHIRAFAAIAAVAACASLALVLVIDPIAWFVLRLVSGLCMAVLFANVESWINASVGNETRARSLTIYRFVDLGAVTASQYMLPLFGVDGFAVFAAMTMLMMLSIVPVSLADRSNPAPPAPFAFSPRRLWRLSPVAVAGSVAVGLTGASFRSIGPLYAAGLGMDVKSVATFMSAGIVGGIVLQYPLGHLSDRVDRRYVILLATLGAALSGFFMAFAAGGNTGLNLIGIFLFGAFALPLYSLSCAHANDRAAPGEFVLIAAGMLFFWAVGASIGPLFSSILIQWFGPAALFRFTTAVHLALAVYTLVRIHARAPSPDGARRRWSALLRTSPVFARMAAAGSAPDDPGKRVSRDNPKAEGDKAA